MSNPNLAHDFALWLLSASLVDISVILGQLAEELAQRQEPGATECRRAESLIDLRVAYYVAQYHPARGIRPPNCTHPPE